MEFLVISNKQQVSWWCLPNFFGILFRWYIRY